MNNHKPERELSGTEAASTPQVGFPVDVRSLSLAILAVLGIVFTLHWAQAVFMPVMLGVVISYALAPG